MPINLTTSDLLYRDGNGVYQSVIAGTPSQQLEDGAVTNTKLASNAVTSNKIADSALTETKYADDSISAAKLKVNSVSKIYQGTLAADDWSGSAAPYTQTVTTNMSEILSTDEPIIDLLLSDTYAVAVSQEENWAKIYRAVTATGSIIFYAHEVPTRNLYFRARCIRK